MNLRVQYPTLRNTLGLFVFDSPVVKHLHGLYINDLVSLPSYDTDVTRLSWIRMNNTRDLKHEITRRRYNVSRYC